MININKLILVYSLIISILAIVFYLSYKTQLSNASLANINLKAFNSELDSSKQKNIIHELTISQLQYYNDSLNTKVLEITKELHIKNSKLRTTCVKLKKVIRLINIKKVLHKNRRNRKSYTQLFFGFYYFNKEYL